MDVKVAENKAARWLGALALAVALVLGGLAGAGAGAGSKGGARTGVAWAEESSSYTITIQNATSGSYAAYQVFAATYDEDGAIATIALNSSTQDAVLTALAAYTGCTYTVSTDSDGTTSYAITEQGAQAATSYTAVTFVNAVAEDIEALSSSHAQAFANALAAALTATSASGEALYTPAATASFTASASAASASLSVGATGYYLVVQTTASSSSDAVTSAILVTVTESGATVTAKVSTPTLDKAVKDDDSDSWDGSYTTYSYTTTTDGSTTTTTLDVSDVADAGVSSTTSSEDGTTSTAYELSSLSYQLTGTVASNIAEYSTYYYAFVDLLPEGVSLTDADGTASVARVTNSSDTTVWSVSYYLVTTSTDEETGETTTTSEKITLASTVESDFTVSVVNVTSGSGSDAVTQSQVTWACSDLLAVLKGATYGNGNTDLETSDYANVQVVLEYSIELTSDEIAALYSTLSSLSDPQVNTAKLVFSNSPYATSTGETPEDTTQVYSYNLVISKQGEVEDTYVDASGTYYYYDSDTDTYTDADGTAYTGETSELTQVETLPLTGAAFTLTYVDDDGNTVTAGKDITATSEADGTATFTFTGLEAGVTYTISESTVPAGYQAIDPITFTITATVDAAGETVTSISVAETSDPSDAATLAIGTNTESDATGTATVMATIVNKQASDLPLTGAVGIAAGIVLGGALIVVSCIALVRNRRREE